MPAKTDLEWANEWLEEVSSGRLTMSQRRVSTVERRGGLTFISRIAREKGVHLLLLEDDEGHRLVAASVHPFKVIC